MPMKFTLIRHTSPDVAKGTFYGQTDVSLKDSFEKEAESVKLNLDGKEFDSVFTSPLTRCRKLAAFCGYPDAEPSPLIMEMNFGAWEMKRFDEIPSDILEKYYSNWRTANTPEGESFTQHGQRVREFINLCISRNFKSVLAFTHGGSILHAMILAAIIDDSRPFDHIPSFGSITELEFNSMI